MRMREGVEAASRGQDGARRPSGLLAKRLPLGLLRLLPPGLGVGSEDGFHTHTKWYFPGLRALSGVYSYLLGAGAQVGSSRSRSH